MERKGLNPEDILRINQGSVDTLPYQTFNKLKAKFPVKTIRISQKEFALSGTQIAFKDHREFIAHKFSQQNIRITRWSHDYASLDTADQKLGLVYLASDSILDEALEVHALLGHNAQYAEGN